MSTTPLEITGLTVEEAITAGLEQLNRPREAVEIEIIDEGSKGLFGLGSRDAIVRLTPLEKPTQSIPSTDTPLAVSQDQKPQSLPSLAYESEETPPSTQDQEQDAEEDYLLLLARDTVSDLIQKMHVDAEVIASYQEQEDESRSRPSILVEVNGDDLSILIGRQAETLNALQFITRLIVGKELSRGIDLQVDVQGYRARRAEQLQRIAHQMADQAIRTGKRQYLEPMPSDDRRLIHIALRNHPDVTTESMGEGSRRKVTILPR
ncbi:MAG TPA: RNA-binding cell elongation regulator Jag/EloR [Anaerolineales bacterium]|nr:RNA-binding cell elongation regulator Jag/EloR [Anaerolineales bacterium]